MKLVVNTGMRVADRFTILKFIAEGGMGEVYEARDEVLDEKIAVKFLSHRNLGDENVTRRFRREIQLARKVTHPNVCRVYDLYQHDVPVPGTMQFVPVAFVTMELLQGITLEDYLKENGALSEAEALPILVQMCRALHAAHTAGIIHRDFKSNNVMLVPADEGDGNRVVVTDFGLARSMIPTDPSRTPLTADSLILGTADYMSPEQIRGDPVSPKSDLYSLGVVMFEMLTGEKPYQASNPMQLLVKRVSEPPARPRDYVADISANWESVIMRCLAEDPADRPASMDDVLHGLDLTEELISLYPPVRKSSRHDTEQAVPVERSSTRPWTGWAAALVFAALATVSWWGSQDARRQDAAELRFNPERLTSAPGLELDPDVSADGRRLVYSGETGDGGFGLFVRELGIDTPPTPLLVDPLQRALEPTWTPDGKHVVFHSQPSGGLWRIAADGTGPARQIVAQGSRPTYSRDGRFLAFQTLASPLFSDTSVPGPPGSVIAVLEDKADEPRPVTELDQPEGGHGSPIFSADGRFIVFTTSQRSQSELWAVEPASGRLIPILKTPSAYDPAFAPDGRTLYFTSRQREVKRLWQVKVDPGTMEPVSVPREVAGIGLSSIRQPTLSRDGTLIYSAFLTRSNLWAVDLDADGRPGEPRPLTVGNDRYNRPAFSPDGSRIAFDHWKLGVDIDVFELEPATGNRRPLTRGNGTNSHGNWLPDGRLVYARISPDQRIELHRLEAATLDDETLFQLESGDDWPRVSPDGKLLAFHSRRGDQDLDIWIRSMDEGPAWRLTFHHTAAAFPCWSNRGDAVAYHVRVSAGSELWLAPVDGREPRRLVDALGESWPYSFSPDDSKIAFAGRRDGSWDIFQVDVEDRRVKPLTESRSLTGYVRYPAWSPKGDQVIYEKSETSSDLFVVPAFQPGP